MKLWFVEPYDDELLSSWLIRTAIAQGCQLNRTGFVGDFFI